MSGQAPLKRRIETVKIVGTYVLFGVAWIFGSDTALGWLVQDQGVMVKIAVVKGSLFIFCTATLLYFLISRFIQQLIAAESKQRESLTNYRIIFNATNEAIFIHDAHTGSILDVNDRMLEMYGYTRDEALTVDITELSEKSSRYSKAEAAEKIQSAAGGPQIFEWRSRKKTGEVFWTEVSLKQVTMHNYDSIIAVVRDISERKQSEEHLRQSEEKYRTVADYIHDWEYWRGPDGSLVYVSPSCKRITGYRAEEFSQEPELFTSIIHPDDRQNFRQHVDSLAEGMAKGDFRTLEFRIITRNGEERLIEHICKEVFDQEGKSLGRRVSNRDITEQKRAELKLLESEKLYRSLFENMMNGFAYCRMLFENGEPLDFIYLAVNDAFERQTGLKDVVGKKATEVIPEIREKDPELFKIYGRVAITRDPARFEIFVEAMKMWLSISVYSPSPQHIVTVFDVITERKKAEEALRESEARLKLVLDGSRLGFWDWNIETGEVIRNARWAEMLDYTLEGVESSVQQWTDLHHPEDKGLALKSINDHLAGRTSAHQIEYRMLAKDGQYKWILDQAKIVSWDSQGKPLRMCGTHTDITELKLAEQEREKLQNQLSQAQKMESIGRLAGGVAHDFNNMLSVIIGYAELALEQIDPSSSLHEELQEIYNAALRSAEITQQLLAFARKQTITPKILNLNDTIEDMLKMLRRLIGEDIDLAWLPGSALGKIKMDPSQLNQLLANLSVNSRDAIEGVGKVTVETGSVNLDEVYCENHEGFTPGDYILLAFSDDGCGMEEEVLNKIFEPFFTTKEVGKGTGLGLAMVYGIVRQNNGFINVYSELGHGTTFNIYLPVYKSDNDEMAAKTIPDTPAGGNETILLVEDDASVMKLGKIMLEKLGYTVLTTNTPSDAIRIAKENAGKIHLVITDVVMPEMNGRDLSRQILSLSPDIKTLFMSGYTADVIAHRGILDEGVHFIHKPFSTKDLAIKVREALE
jgi:two-component system, cell cycle sensor histidine kinase and response regulator CckA